MMIQSSIILLSTQRKSCGISQAAGFTNRTSVFCGNIGWPSLPSEKKTKETAAVVYLEGDSLEVVKKFPEIIRRKLGEDTEERFGCGKDTIKRS